MAGGGIGVWRRTQEPASGGDKGDRELSLVYAVLECPVHGACCIAMQLRGIADQHNEGPAHLLLHIRPCLLHHLHTRSC